MADLPPSAAVGPSARAAAPGPTRSRAWLLVAALLALLAGGSVISEAVADPAHTLVCNYVHPDCLSNHWLMVWVADQVLHGGSILHNDRYYWPIGDAPWLAGNGSEGFAYAPWHALLGWPLGANAYLLMILTLNGVAAYALARASGATGAGSLAAAPTGVLLVYCVQELGAGRFSQVSVCWMAFFLAAWMRHLDRGTTRSAVVAAVLLALTALFYWYYAFFAVLAGAVLLAARLVVPRVPGGGPRASAPSLRGLVVFSVTFLALVAPLLYVFLHNWQEIPGTAEAAFPHPESLADSTWPGVPFLPMGGRHAGRALPLTTCLLAVFGLWRGPDRWRSTGLLGVALLFAGLMAGGLIPHGPYEQIYGLASPLRRFWWPYRHVAMLNLALIALAARGSDALFRSWRWPAVLVALSIPLQLTWESAPWHAQFTRVDAPVTFYQQVGDGPGTILLEPPLSPTVASAQTPLIYQLYHHKILLGGHAMWVERVRPPAWDAFVDGNSFLAEMRRLETGKVDGVFRFQGADLRALVDAGVGQIVVNREYFPLSLEAIPDAYVVLANALFGEPSHTAKRAKVWDLTAWNGQTEVAVPPVVWPAGVLPGGPTLSIQGVRPPSLAFSVPGPTGPPPPRSGPNSGPSGGPNGGPPGGPGAPP